MSEVEAFGRYQLLRVVGTGGMAQVHMARQVGPERFVKPCVLKRISRDHLHNSVVHSLFLEEAKVSALFNHPNIVTTFDFGTVDGVPYMAMELVDGVNLAQLCRSLAARGRWLALGPAVEILLAVLEALDYAHNMSDLEGRPLNLVHRDVSPQNVLLSRRGQVKLADFGIARHDQREVKTVGPTTKGKPGYMAPEQAMGSEVDPRADLYAIGIMLAELISARRVINPKERVAVHKINDRVRELCALRPDAPKALVDVALRLTSLEPDSRPPTARATASLVRSAAAGLPLDTLGSVLSGIFGAFFPEGIKPEEPSVSPSPPNMAAVVEATEIMPGPPSDMAEAAQQVWASPEPPQGTAAAYESGWPDSMRDPSELRRGVSTSGGNKLSLPSPYPSPATPAPAAPPGPTGAQIAEAAQIEVMHRSSGIDAMQFFPPEFSDAAKQRKEGQKDAPIPAPGARTGITAINSGKKLNILPVASVAIEQAIQAAQEANDIVNEQAGAKREGLPPVVPLVGAALAVLLIALGVVAAFALRSPDAPKVTKTGTIHVTSIPPGAPVTLDNKPTQLKTPADLTGLSLKATHRIAVSLPGHLSVPREVPVLIPAIGETTVKFDLKPGRAFRVESVPPDAIVEVNGKRLSSVTPALLDVVPFGRTASVTIKLDGFMPYDLKLKALVNTATITVAKLKPGKSVDLMTNPPGADVTLDKRPLGKTPLYDVLVPVDTPFSLVITRLGYKPFKDRMSAKKLTGPIEIDLKEVSFLAMPMAPEERKEAKALDVKLTKLEADRRRTEQRLKDAENKLATVEGSRQNFVGDIADVQRVVDEQRAHLEEVESKISEVEAAIDSMRQAIQERMEREQ